MKTVESLQIRGLRIECMRFFDAFSRKTVQICVSYLPVCEPLTGECTVTFFGETTLFLDSRDAGVMLVCAVGISDR